MRNIPVISASELMKALERLGFSYVSQRGSHIKMKHPDGRVAIIPNQKAIKKVNA